jgi:signal transduction histidine kinase
VGERRGRVRAAPARRRGRTFPCHGRLPLDGAVARADDSARLVATRHALRVLCVAARAAWAAPDAVPIRREDVPPSVPAVALVRALTRRLTTQTVDARDGRQHAAEPLDVLRALRALDRVESALVQDAGRHAADIARGVAGMDLVVEVAHDMRSPLGSILFLVERLRRTAGASPERASELRQLELIHGATFGLSSMVSDVMELARGGGGLGSTEPGPFVVAEVVEGVRAIVAPLAEEKGLRLEVVAPPRDVRIGRGPALHRVLVNLVTNALKFTPAGHVSLRVETRSRTRLAFVVRDTGRGIPPRVLAELFEAFRRRATGEGFAFSSAGLGLAICRNLLGAMGSELRVESTVEVGTTFSFEVELPPREG